MTIQEYNDNLRAQDRARAMRHKAQPAGLAAYQERKSQQEAAAIAPYVVEKDGRCYTVSLEGNAVESFPTKKAAITWIMQAKETPVPAPAPAAPAEPAASPEPIERRETISTEGGQHRMNTQDILARVRTAISLLDPDHSVCAKIELHKLADDLEAKIRLETASQRGSLDAVKTITRMLNDVKKSNRPALAYAWTDDQGRQCACDGFRAYRLKDALPLEARPEDAGKPINLDNIFHAPVSDPELALELPTVGELKAHIAVETANARATLSRAERKNFTPIWDFGEGKPAVNAGFLLDMLAVMGNDAKAFADTLTGKMNALATVWFTSERGDALLLPMRIAEKKEQQNQQNAQREAEEEAARDAERRRNYHAHMLREMLNDYTAMVERDSEYAMDPRQFVNLAQYADDYAA